MEIHLPEDLERFVRDQFARGCYPSEGAVLVDTVVEQPPVVAMPEKDPTLGMFRDDPHLIDEIVEDAMRSRGGQPWGLPADE